MSKVYSTLLFPAIVSLFLYSSFVYPQNYLSPTNGPNGGAFTAITITSSGTIYAGTGSMGFGDGEGAGGNGVYKSVDGGNNWTHSGLKNLYVSALEFDSNGHIYAGCYAGEKPWDTKSKKGVYRSTNSGNDWELMGLENYEIYDLLFVPGKGLYASTGYSAVFKWTGTEWEEHKVSSSSGWVQRLTVNSNGILFAGTAGGLYRSDDDGVTWTELSKKNIYDFAILSNGRIVTLTDSKIYFSDNSGDSWTEAAGNYYFFRNMTVTPNDNIFIAGYYDGIKVSTNGGENWLAANNGFTSTSFSVIASDSNGVVYAGSFKGFGIYKSTDSGLNWSSCSNGLKNSMITTINVTPDEKIYAGGNNGIHYSEDNGSTWQNLWQQNWHFEEFINDIEFFKNKIYLATDKSYVQIAEVGSSNWQTSSVGLTSNARINCLLGINNNLLIAGTDGDGIFTTADEGANWTKTANGLRVFDLASEPNGNILAAAGYSIYRSTDGGSTWNTSEPLYYGGTMAIHKLAVNSGGHIFVATAIGLYRSMDEGKNFEQVGNFPFSTGSSTQADVFDVVINNLGYIFAGVGRGDSFGVYASLDNGNTWEKVSSGLEGYSVRSLALSPSQVLYVGTFSNGVYRSTVPTKVDEKNFLPADFSLQQNYPNPFNPSTTIEYSLFEEGFVSLKVYDICGNEVAVLVNENQNAGYHVSKFSIQNSNLASGIYFYRLLFKGNQLTRKLMILK